jgi:hypothetical protein
MFLERMNLNFIAMKNSIKLRIVCFLLSYAFLLYTAGSIPHIISWLPMLVTVYFAAKDRAFRVWFLRLSRWICGAE